MLEACQHIIIANIYNYFANFEFIKMNNFNAINIIIKIMNLIHYFIFRFISLALFCTEK